MPKNLFLEKEAVLQKRHEEIDSAIHNENIAENFLRLMGNSASNVDEDCIKEENLNTRMQQNMHLDVEDDFQLQLENAMQENEYSILDRIENELSLQTQIQSAQEDRQSFFAANTLQEQDNTMHVYQENIDLMPTETTTQYLDSLYEEEVKERLEEKELKNIMSKKATMFVSIGIAIMSIILALICINIGVINKLQAGLADVTNQYAAVANTVSIKQQELNNLQLPENIIHRAELELGMYNPNK